MVFPKSNLSTASQPWGRFVEKSITGLETVVATDRVNNAARDAQAALNIKRLDASLAQVANLGLQTAQNVADIQTITDSVFSLNTDVNTIESNVFVTGTTQINGYNIKAGTINASAINVGNLTGFNIKTAASGTYTELSGTNIKFYFNNNLAGYIVGDDGSWSSATSMRLASASYPTGNSTILTVEDTGIGMDYFGTYNYSVYMDSGGVFLSGRSVTIDQFASGSVSVPGSSTGTTTSATFTFPSGRFTTTPQLVCTPNTSVPYTAVRMFGGVATSASGGIIYVNRTNSTATNFQWLASNLG